jgi:hypothetical protein
MGNQGGAINAILIRGVMTLGAGTLGEAAGSMIERLSAAMAISFSEG